MRLKWPCVLYVGKHVQRALRQEAQARHDRGPPVHVGHADFSAMHVGHVRGPPDHDRHEMNDQKRPIKRASEVEIEKIRRGRSAALVKFD